MERWELQILPLTLPHLRCCDPDITADCRASQRQLSQLIQQAPLLNEIPADLEFGRQKLRTLSPRNPPRYRLGHTLENLLGVFKGTHYPTTAETCTVRWRM